MVLIGCGGDKAAPREALSNKATIVVLDRAPADAVELNVRVVRWSCAVSHPREVSTPDLVIPAGRPIKLVAATPEQGSDVGMEVALVGTRVAKPVRFDHPVEIAFRVDEPGTYQWRCPTIVPPKGGDNMDPAQYDPVKSFRVIPAAEYDAFLAANDPNDPANQLTLGRQVYERKGCVSCHSLDGSARVGPSWAGIWGTTVTLADGSSRVVDEAYVRQSVETPSAFGRPGFPIGTMPSFQGQLRERELKAVTAFIASLKDVKTLAQ